VVEALAWLKLHNYLYKDLNISNWTNSSSSCAENQSCDVDMESILELSAIPTDYIQPNIDMEASLNNKRGISLPIINDLTNIMCKSDGEEMTFPWLFPYGKSGFKADRPKKLTFLQYYKSRLYNIDSRWRKDISYLFSSVNSFESNRLFECISIYLRIKKNDNSFLQLQNVTTPSSDLISNSYMFMKSIRGTVAYWKDVLFDLISMMKNLGPPTLFMTLSANDYHWPQLATMLNVELKDLPSAVQQNPLMVAVHFERRWRALLNKVIKGPKAPLGIVKDFFCTCRISSQRESTSSHFLLD
jgi:hypothetical protein